jgi:5-bromo-4-chloroindolyl phosphate hydrolysis protein
MQIYANDRTLNFKAKLGKILAFGGVGIVIFIFILSFQEGILTNILLVVAVIGMLVFQYGYFLNNRWGKHPRIDEVFDQALKGFDSRYSIFHYELGTNHVLIGPGGIFALVPLESNSRS